MPEENHKVPEIENGHQTLRGPIYSLDAIIALQQVLANGIPEELADSIRCAQAPRINPHVDADANNFQQASIERLAVEIPKPLAVELANSASGTSQAAGDWLSRVVQYLRTLAKRFRKSDTRDRSSAHNAR